VLTTLLDIQHHMNDFKNLKQIPRFDKESEYHDWTITFLSYLELLDAEHHILAPPESPTDKEKAVQKKLLALLNIAVAADLRDVIQDCTTPQKAWKKLQEEYSQTTTAKKLLVKSKFTQARMNENHKTLTQHYKNLKVHLKNCANAEIAITDDEKMATYISSLNQHFLPLKLQLLSLKNPTFTDVHTLYKQVVQSEPNQHDDEDEPNLGLTASLKYCKFHRTDKHSDAECKRQKNDVHQPTKQKQPQLQKFCTFHHSRTHSTSECNALKQQNHANQTNGQHNAHQLNQQDDTHQGFHTTALNNQFDTILSVNQNQNQETWFMDSGASDHCTHSKERLSDYKATPNRKLQIADGTVLEVAGTGHMAFQVTAPNQNIFRSRLLNVLHVPAMAVQLVSVKKFAAVKDCSVKFQGSTVAVSLKDQEVMTGHLTGNLYTIQLHEQYLAPTTNAHHASQPSHISQADIWHARLGHLNFSDVKKIIPQAVGRPSFCTTCAIAKSTRAPLTGTRATSTHIGQTTHLDVWGPTEVASLSGKRYYVVIVDGYSNFVEVHLLSHKSETTNIYKSYDAKMETRGTRLKHLLFDGGGEFLNKELISYLAQRGTTYENTPRSTPELNGKAERSHRTITSRARALRLAANLPKSLWGELSLTAAHLINTSPSSTNPNNQSPYQIFHERQYDYSRLRTIGSRAFAHISHDARRKLDQPATEGVLVGYARNSQGYRIYFPNTQKVIETCHVRFDESTPLQISYPQQSIHSTNTKKTPTKSNPAPHTPCLDFDLELQTPTIEAPLPPSTPPRQSQVQAAPITPRPPTRILSLPTLVPPKLFDVPRQQAPPAQDTLDAPPPRRSQRIQTLEPVNYQDDTDDAEEHEPTTTSFFIQDTPTSFFLANNDPDTLTYRETLNNDESPMWRTGTKDEIQALKSNETYKITALPPNKRAIGSRFTYRRKRNGEGTVYKYKVRWVAQGFTQQPGIDFHHTFSPVANYITLLTMFHIALNNDWLIHQMDIDNAFLHAHLPEQIFMKIPEGTDDQELETARKQGSVLLLLRSLYGLRQASREWFTLLKARLESKQWKPSHIDQCLFTKTFDGKHPGYIIIYVDDLILIGPNDDIITEIKSNINADFPAKDLGKLSHLLGIRFARTDTESISLDQSALIQKFITKFIPHNRAKPSTPITYTTYSLCIESIADQTSTLAPRQINLYQQIVGSLNHIARHTRFDILFAVSFLSRFAHQPTQHCLDAAFNVLRYLHLTINHSFEIRKSTNPLQLTLITDSDWASDTNSRRSVSGTILKLGNNAIHCHCKLQPSIAQSTMESELIAMSSGLDKILRLKEFIQETFPTTKIKTNILCDNQSALNLITGKSESSSIFSKHVDIRYKAIREHIQAHNIQTSHVKSTLNTADILTKCLPKSTFNNHRQGLAIKDLSFATSIGGVLESESCHSSESSE
jgi:hypothetical protein